MHSLCVLKLFGNAHFLFPEEQNKKEEKSTSDIGEDGNNHMLPEREVGSQNVSRAQRKSPGHAASR